MRPLALGGRWGPHWIHWERRKGKSGLGQALVTNWGGPRPWGSLSVVVAGISQVVTLELQAGETWGALAREKQKEEGKKKKA